MNERGRIQQLNRILNEARLTGGLKEISDNLDNLYDLVGQAEAEIKYIDEIIYEDIDEQGLSKLSNPLKAIKKALDSLENKLSSFEQKLK